MSNAISNKSCWIGWIVVLVVMNVYGYVIHELGLSETYQSLASVFRPKEEMDSMMWMMMIGGAVGLLLFCYIFTLGHEGKGVMTQYVSRERHRPQCAAVLRGL